jgi:FtsH-binding integral membrane protein
MSTKKNTRSPESYKETTSAIYKSTAKTVGIGLILFGGVCGFFDKTSWTLSALLGVIFSFLSFRQLINAQKLILTQGKTGKVLILFILRLALTAAPIIIVLVEKKTFNLWITLIFLFSFQVTFIVSSLKSRYGRVKERIKDLNDQWTNSAK